MLDPDLGSALNTCGSETLVVFNLNYILTAAEEEPLSDLSVNLPAAGCLGEKDGPGMMYNSRDSSGTDTDDNSLVIIPKETENCTCDTLDLCQICQSFQVPSFFSF